MIRTATRYYLKDSGHIFGSHIGKTIPIYVSPDGERMTLNPSSIHTSYYCWHLQVRSDANGQYIEMPLEKDEMTILLARFIQP